MARPGAVRSNVSRVCVCVVIGTSGPPELPDVAVEVVFVLHLWTRRQFVADTRPLCGHEDAVSRLESFRGSTFLGCTPVAVVFADLARARCALSLTPTNSLKPKKNK